MKISIKNIFRYFVRFIILLLLAYILFSLYLQYFAQDHIKSFMSRSFNKDVEFTRIVYRFPLEFQVYDVTIGDFLSMDGMSVRFSKDFLVDKDINIAKLLFVKPTLNLREFVSTAIEESQSDLEAESPSSAISTEETQTKDTEINEIVPSQEVQLSPVSADEETEEETEQADHPKYNIRVGNFVVSNGRLIYPYMFSGKEILVDIEELTLQAQKISYPFQNEQTKIEFIGRLLKLTDNFPEGLISGKGWVNVVSSDLDGAIYLKNEEQGELLDAHIVSKKNNVFVEGEINSKDLIRKRKSPDKPGSMEDMAAKALSFLGVDIGINFYFETKLNDFKISNVSFSGRVGKPASEMKSE